MDNSKPKVTLILRDGEDVEKVVEGEYMIGAIVIDSSDSGNRIAAIEHGEASIATRASAHMACHKQIDPALFVLYKLIFNKEEEEAEEEEE